MFRPSDSDTIVLLLKQYCYLLLLANIEINVIIPYSETVDVCNTMYYQHFVVRQITMYKHL